MSTYTQQYTRPYSGGYVDRPDESTPEYARYINARDDALIRIEAFLAALNIPEKLSELVNDEGFIKSTVSNLANYYLKSETYSRTETYTQAEVQALIADAVAKVAGKLNISVVDTLPTSDISTTTFYLVPKETAQEKNLYDEYINTDGTEGGWELIGAVSTSVDLSNYYKKSEVDALLDTKLNKTDLVESKFDGKKTVIGKQVSGSGGSGSETVRYNSETDYIELLLNDAWNEWKRAGLQWLDTDPVYIRLEVTETSKNASSGYVQFSDLLFEDADGNALVFEDTCVVTASGNNTDGALNRGIDGNQSTKLCIAFSTSSPFWYQIKTDTTKLTDLKNYPIFKIRNGNDTAGTGRIPISFALKISMNGEDWITLISESNITPLSTANYEIAYEKEITNWGGIN